MLDPADYGLPRRVFLEEHEGGIALVIDRKSRLVLADGVRILAQIQAIRNKADGQAVMLKTTAPVCSKTILFLQEHGIPVLPAR